MPIRYMIIDDEPIAHRIIEDYCAEMANLALVNNSYHALAALEYLHSNSVDLIFLDIGMPKLDGLEVLRRLKASPLTASLTCIALSANAMPEDIRSALALGFDDYWTKPIDIQAVTTTLRGLASSSDNRQP